MIIKGIPKAQKRHRHTKRGIVYDPSSPDKKEYIKQLLDQKPEKPYDQPISIAVEFVMPYPKKHYRSGKYSHILKINAPTRHSIKPDLDNLIKLLLDVLQDAEYIKDDSLITNIFAGKKYGEDPHTEFEIYTTGDHE